MTKRATASLDKCRKSRNNGWLLDSAHMPTLLAIAIQTLAGSVAITMLYAQLSNGVENTRNTAERLSAIVERQANTQYNLSERLVRVETSIGSIRDTIKAT